MLFNAFHQRPDDLLSCNTGQTSLRTGRDLVHHRRQHRFLGNSDGIAHTIKSPAHRHLVEQRAEWTWAAIQIIDKSARQL